MNLTSTLARVLLMTSTCFSSMFMVSCGQVTLALPTYQSQWTALRRARALPQLRGAPCKLAGADCSKLPLLLSSLDPVD